MLFTAGSRWIAPARVPQPEAVTVHEAGHQFWYGIVGSNEFEHAWMDEGLNTFSTARAMDEARMPDRLALRFFGGFVPWVIDDIRLSRATDGNRLSGYRDNAEADAQATPTFHTGRARLRSSPTTRRRSGCTRSSGISVGLLQRIMSTYFERWKFRHPQPADFFAVVNEVSGAGHDLVLRPGISQLERVRLRRANVYEHEGPAACLAEVGVGARRR